MSLLRLKDVKLTYTMEGRETHVLNRVDLNIERGEMVAILGPSGSGKSTLLYILGCLLKPTSGDYEFAGHNIRSMDPQHLAQLRSNEIGFVFQQFHLLPRATVLQNVLLASQYHASDQSAEALRSRAREILKTLGLETHLKHHPNQLSGGQQQRVAIARALMNSPSLILADEPTGNLDSKSATQVLDTLTEIHKSGRTVIIITHDQNVAARCQRVVTIQDGLLKSEMPAAASKEAPTKLKWRQLPSLASQIMPILTTATQNLMRNKTRSFLTMLGVTIGIAAVLATITLGTYTKDKILQSYETLGVNKVVLEVYPNWRIKARDIKRIKYEGVSIDHDIPAIQKLFSNDIQLLSPLMRDWISSVEYGGHTADQARIIGVWPEYFAITNRQVVLGQPISEYHMKNHSRVCVIGYEIAQKLFGNSSPLRKILQINGNNNNQYTCQILGVLASQQSNDEWSKPNLQIIVPLTYLSNSAYGQNKKVYEVDVTVKPGASIDNFATESKEYFNRKYGRSVEAHVDSNQILIAQMKRFLTLFTILLSCVALIALAVGGIGITNMMFVSVAERFKEIGLRKALGAQDEEIRMQFLIESVILCALAGVAGVVFGIAGYETLLWFASKLFPKVHFEWVINGPAILLAVVCIFVVGVASGLVPALRAQKLEVVEALRSE